MLLLVFVLFTAGKPLMDFTAKMSDPHYEWVVLNSPDDVQGHENSDLDEYEMDQFFSPEVHLYAFLPKLQISFYYKKDTFPDVSPDILLPPPDQFS